MGSGVPGAMGRQRTPVEGPETKTCAICGRVMEYRKRWARSWDSVKYCSDACRRLRNPAEERRLEEAIVSLLAARAGNATLCPSEVARAEEADDWRPLMEPVRQAGRRLAAQGRVVFRQGGAIVDPSTAKGPVRLGRGPQW